MQIFIEQHPQNNHPTTNHAGDFYLENLVSTEDDLGGGALADALLLTIAMFTLQ